MTCPQFQCRKNKSDGPCLVSPTWNYVSHDKWASRHLNALDAVHEIAPPTHWATIKFNTPMLTRGIRDFLKTLSKAIEYLNRCTAEKLTVSSELEITSTGKHIALFAVAEIDAGGCVHYHVLIRASGIEPEKVLETVIAKYNAKKSTKITLPYIERPKSHNAVSIYSVKLGRRDTLLFSSGSLPRYTYTAGKYFLGIPLRELRASTRNDYFLTKAEIEVNKIVADMPLHEPATASTNESQSTSNFRFKTYTPRIGLHIYNLTASVFLDSS